MPDATAHVATVHQNLAAPPRADGYRPITDSLWTFGALGARPPDVQARWLLASAHKCDIAHLQFERLRDTIDEIEGSISEAGRASPPVRRRVHEATGDAQLAITALHRALELAGKIGDSGVRWIKRPATLRAAEEKVRQLRDVYEHPEGVLKGMIAGEPNPAKLGAMQYAALFRERRLHGPAGDLGIDDEATQLLIELRSYLVAAWKAAMTVG